MPRNKKDKTDEYYRTNKMSYVMAYLNLSEKDAAAFLEQYFDYLTDPANMELEEKGWTVLRFWESDVRSNLEGCVKQILEKYSAIKQEITNQGHSKKS